MAFNLDERIKKQTKTQVLIVDENLEDQEYLISAFSKTDYSFICCNHIDRGVKTLLEDKEIVNLVILDLSVNSKKGLKFLEEKKNKGPLIEDLF